MKMGSAIDWTENSPKHTVVLTNKTQQKRNIQESIAVNNQMSLCVFLHVEAYQKWRKPEMTIEDSPEYTMINRPFHWGLNTQWFQG